jgi:hypothetical protein
MKSQGWFDVDREGMRRALAGRRGPEHLLYELIQNAWDAGAANVGITLEPTGERSRARLVVEDDGRGFDDLRSAYTLFGASGSAADPEKRGRFCVGEKLVLAFCETAEIRSLGGSISFAADGRRHGRKRTERGTCVSAILKISRDITDTLVKAVARLIVPDGIAMTINGAPVAARPALATAEHVFLLTDVVGDEGVLSRRYRHTQITIHETAPGETAFLYEMGIPVVATGDKWHANVRQKVPLSIDRESVSASFLKDVRLAVLEKMADSIVVEDATAPWVRDATSSGECPAQLTEQVLSLRFGERRVAYDPSDTEANARAAERGYTVVHGGSMSAEEWSNARKAGAIQPAGQLFPTHTGTAPAEQVKPTDEMLRIARFIGDASPMLIGRKVSALFISSPGASTMADYSREAGLVRFNVARLPEYWFHCFPDAPQLDLIIHELAHEREPNHRDGKYHDELSRLGAEMAVLALKNPELFGAVDLAEAAE